MTSAAVVIEEASADVSPPHADDRRWFALAVVGVVIALAIPFTTYWTPGGDSDFYASLARNIARGDGYLYNGLKPAISPPGWPYVLAGLMWISPSFLWLNLVQSLLLATGLAMFYPICRHMVGPRLAAAATVVTAVLHPVYPLGTWMHSEPLYLVIANAAVLAALRYARTKDERARLDWFLLAGLLGVLAIVVRWTGLFHWLVAAAALVSLRPPGMTTLDRLTRPVARAVACSLVIGLSFLGLWESMNVTTVVASPEFVDEGERGKTTEEILAGATPPPSVQLTTRPAEPPMSLEYEPPKRPAGGESQVTQESLGHGAFLAGALVEYVGRLANAGTWASWLLWYPTRFASGLPGANIAVAVVGWAALILFGIGVTRMPAVGRWLAAGVVAYLVTLALMWPNPNARYLVPVAPMVICGVLLGAARVARWLPIAVVAAVLLANLPLYAVDAWLARVPGAAAEHFEAGSVAPLVAGCELVRESGAGDRAVVVSERYINFGKVRRMRTGARAAQFVLDADLQMMPIAVPDEWWDPRLADHLWRHGAGFYLYQEPAEPWRLWHFRLPRGLQEMLAGEPVTVESGGWQLYQVFPPGDGHDQPRLERVWLDVDPDTFEWPDRVPGL